MDANTVPEEEEEEEEEKEHRGSALAAEEEGGLKPMFTWTDLKQPGKLR